MKNLIKLKYSSWAFLFLFILGIGCGKDDGPEVPVEPEAVKSIDVVDLRTEDDKVFPGDDVSFTIKGIVGPLKKVEVEIGGVKAKTVIGKDGKVTVTMPEKLVFPIKITANGVVKTLKNTDGPFKGIEVRNDFEIVSASDGTFKPGDEIKLKSRGLGNSAADIEIVMGGAKVEKLKLDKGVLEFKLPAEAGFPIVIKKGKEKTMEYAKGKAPFDKFIFGETGTDGEEVSVKITTSLGEYRGLPIAVQVGDKIKASVENMANGVKVAYAWQRVGPDNEIAGISGATKAEYTIAEEDAGKEIRVKISYKVGEKEAKKLTSESLKISKDKLVLYYRNGEENDPGEEKGSFWIMAVEYVDGKPVVNTKSIFNYVVYDGAGKEIYSWNTGYIANSEIVGEKEGLQKFLGGKEYSLKVFKKSKDSKSYMSGSISKSENNLATLQWPTNLIGEHYRVDEILHTKYNDKDNVPGKSAIKHIWVRLKDGKAEVIEQAKTESYTLTKEDEGAKIYLFASYEDGNGNSENLYLATSKVIKARLKVVKIVNKDTGKSEIKAGDEIRIQFPDGLTYKKDIKEIQFYSHNVNGDKEMSPVIPFLGDNSEIKERIPQGGGIDYVYATITLTNGDTVRTEKNYLSDSKGVLWVYVNDTHNLVNTSSDLPNSAKLYSIFKDNDGTEGLSYTWSVLNQDNNKLVKVSQERTYAFDMDEISKDDGDALYTLIIDVIYADMRSFEIKLVSKKFENLKKE